MSMEYSAFLSCDRGDPPGSDVMQQLKSATATGWSELSIGLRNETTSFPVVRGTRGTILLAPPFSPAYCSTDHSTHSSGPPNVLSERIRGDRIKPFPLHAEPRGGAHCVIKSIICRAGGSQSNSGTRAVGPS
ncbi:hypothetical protein DPEC_G00149030 [Dallia pectoralis]|uniref:Uncharacterized protein n=1 Tax=Dallia pectoralis TaxID=75939 RepID=A0ACC2GIU6_DALPE|nr:hypothetical protein DPEC_G00149030 [Dallia pectoralis]